MSQRLLNTTKWLWCVLALYAGPVRSVTARTPPKNPSTIEAQAKFFQDFFSVQLSPYKIEFGHVCEDPNTWEQRYEKKDFKNHRDMGKVRWGDKKGGYGEHYWDLNHAGHAGNHGDHGYDDSDSDDGSYNERDHSSDSYDEPSDNVNTYDNVDYDPEKSSRYEENGRAKRAHPRIKIERKYQKDETYEEEHPTRPQKQNRKNKEQLQAAETHNVEKYTEIVEPEEEPVRKPSKKRPQRRPEHEYNEEEHQPKEKNQVVLVVNQKDDTQEQPSQYVQRRQPEPTHYVPYEGGAGVRQHQQPEASASVPRLFLEPSTGHVVDRATGQAYVLQPIVSKNYN